MSEQTILVAYASSGGSTADVAEAIGKTLREGGLQVEIHPASAVKDLTPYSAIVLGSAIQAGQWLPDALNFLQAHQVQLQHKPVAAFVVCMTMSMRPAFLRGAAKNFLKPVREIVTPISEGCFAGVVDFARVTQGDDVGERMLRMMFRLGVFSEGDHRDWNAIRMWAHDLSSKLTQQHNGLQPKPAQVKH